jgi:two-component system, NtrC family, sensor kinase
VTVAAAPLSMPVGIDSARRTLSLAQKFAIAFLSLVAAVLVINGAIDMVLTYREARTQAIRVQQEKADAAAERVAQFVAEIEQQLGWTTRGEWSRVAVEQRRYDFIRLLRQAPAITELVHADSTGRELLKLSRLEPDLVGSNTDHAADPRFLATQRDKIYYGPVTFRRGSEPYMTIGMSHAGGKPGATIADVNLKLAWDVVTSIRVGNTGYAYITDPAGRLIAHPDMSLVLRNSDLTGLPQVAAVLRPEAGVTRVTAGRAADGREVLSAHARIPKVGWNVFVELPAAEALGPVWAAFYQTLALLALGVGLAGGAGTMLARRMVVPITALAAGAQKLGEGDLAQRITVQSGDEIGALAGQFNLMAGRIQEAQETLEQKVEDRTAEVQQALEYQTATGDVLSAIARSSTDTQPVFDAIVTNAARLCAAEFSNITLFDGTMMRIAALNNMNEAVKAEFRARYPMRPDRTQINGRVVLDRTIIRVVDILADPDYPPQMAKAGGWRSMLGVPLLSQDKVIGAIVMAKVEVAPYSERQVRLVQTFASQAVIAIENARLFNETKEALEQQTATADILKVISQSAFDLPTVLDTLISSASVLCVADQGIIFLRDGDLFRAHSVYPENPAFLKFMQDHPRRLGDKTIAPRVARSGKVEHIPDKLLDPDYQSTPGATKFSDTRTMLGVPLLREGKVAGVFVLMRVQQRSFTHRQIELTQTFADQAVIAIENVRLFNETQEALEQQTATADVLKVISRSAFDLPTVLRTLIASATRLCGAEQGLISFLREGALIAEASYGTPEGYLEFMRANPMKPGRETFSGRAALTGEVVNIADALADDEFTFVEAQKRSGYRAMLAVPLKRDGEVIGVFAMPRAAVGAYSQREVELVQTFADQAVIAIENARLLEEVQARTAELTQSLEDLGAAQDRLVQTEKLASLGQLTAGVAHEIKNPLNFVNNFADLSVELVGEIEDAVRAAGTSLDPKIRAEVDEIAAMLKGNLAKVVHHGRRADSIVKNMLAHSRESGGERRAIDLNATVEEALNLAYHGARAEKPGFNITLERDFDATIGQTEVFPQEFTRVLLNLIGNGFHAANKKRLDGALKDFEPVLKVTTKALPGSVVIKVRDNGTGIPDVVKARIFEPFFTTKPTGEGTGLGLSLSHDIVVKQHGGSLTVATEPGSYTEFTVTLPRTIALPEKKL